MEKKQEGEGGRGCKRGELAGVGTHSPKMTILEEGGGGVGGGVRGGGMRG